MLLLEKNSVIGPKVCAGGLCGHDLDYLNLPEEILDHKFKEIIVHTPHQKDLVRMEDYFVYTIDRKNLGQWQLHRLDNTNVEVRTESRVTDIGRNFVVINGNEKVKFKYLVGADGASSRVRKYLGINTEQMGIAMQYIIPTSKYNKFELFVDPDLFHSWYAWIFPHKKYVSIGCGGDPRFLSAKKFRDNFQIWLKKMKIDVSNREFQAHPINFDYRGFKFRNVFLVGDAAGLSSGYTGEGMYQAMISGEEVAKTIINKKHIPTKIDDLLKVKKVHNKILHVFEKSGNLRKIEYELLVLMLKIKLIDKKIIHILA